MSWIFYALLAGMVWAVVNINDKFVLSKLVKKPIVPIIFLGVISLIVAVAIYLVRGFGNLSAQNIVIALVAGIFYAGMNLLYFTAVQLDDISRLIPIWKINPLFIAIIAAIFLGETFSPVKYLAVLLLLAGSILLSYNKSSGFRFNKAFWLMIIAAIFLAISQVLIKYLLRYTDYWTVYSYVRIGSFLATLPIIYIYRSDFITTIREGRAKVVGFITAGEILNLFATFLITVAAVSGFVTLTNALSMLQPFFVLLFASLISIYYPKILKEEIKGSSIVLKFLAILLMFVGAILVI